MTPTHSVTEGKPETSARVISDVGASYAQSRADAVRRFSLLPEERVLSLHMRTQACRGRLHAASNRLRGNNLKLELYGDLLVQAERGGGAAHRRSPVLRPEVRQHGPGVQLMM